MSQRRGAKSHEHHHRPQHRVVGEGGEREAEEGREGGRGEKHIKPTSSSERVVRKRACCWARKAPSSASICGGVKRLDSTLCVHARPWGLNVARAVCVKQRGWAIIANT